MLGRFKRYIAEGLEDETVELKSELPSDAPGIHKLLREIVAMVNTGRQGYILFGVSDARQRASQEPVCGISHFPTDDEVNLRFEQAVRDYVDPPVRTRFQRFAEPESGRLVGVLTVYRSNARPHGIVKDGAGIRRGDMYVRRGTMIDHLLPDEISRIRNAPTREPVTLLNFSHSFSEEQVAELEKQTGWFVECVFPNDKIELDVSAPFVQQVSSIVEGLGYTPEEWQSGRFVVSLPGLADAAAVMLAELHGRMGHFPTIVRRAPRQPVGFEVVEVIALRDVRDRARRS